MARQRTTITSTDLRTSGVTIARNGVLIVETRGAFQLRDGTAVTLIEGGRVFNDGTIYGGGPAIVGTGATTIFNHGHGYIAGYGGPTIDIAFGSLKLFNQGVIEGGPIVVGGEITLINMHTIGSDFGRGGVHASGGFIHNAQYSSIRGATGILMDDGAGGAAAFGTTIINHGTITANSVTTIRLVGDRDDTIINYGTIDVSNSGFPNYAIDAGGGNDRIVNHGHIGGWVSLGDGDDTFISYGYVHTMIDGGAGDDRIIADDNQFQYIRGGLGRDVMTGNGGTDIFLFETIAESSPDLTRADRITDFSTPGGDAIDLTRIDADATKDGNQALTFMGSSAFSNTPGELRIDPHANWTAVLADVDGDGVADFAIRLDGNYQPADMQFLL